jgi:hypothetical protein
VGDIIADSRATSSGIRRLLPKESRAAVEHVLREQGRSLAISHHTLGNRLRDKGWLVDFDKKSFTKTVRIGAGTSRVFVFARSRLFPSSEEEEGLGAYVHEASDADDGLP